MSVKLPRRKRWCQNPLVLLLVFSGFHITAMRPTENKEDLFVEKPVIPRWNPRQDLCGSELFKTVNTLRLLQSYQLFLLFASWVSTPAFKQVSCHGFKQHRRSLRLIMVDFCADPQDPDRRGQTGCRWRSQRRLVQLSSAHLHTCKDVLMILSWGLQPSEISPAPIGGPKAHSSTQCRRSNDAFERKVWPCCCFRLQHQKTFICFPPRNVSAASSSEALMFGELKIKSSEPLGETISMHLH